MSDRDYSDMVNPYVRAEQEAEQRGFRKGLLTALWWLCIAVICGMLLVSMKANATVVALGQTWGIIKASDCGGRLSICQNNYARGKWQCSCVL